MKTLEDRIKEKQEAIDIQKDILLDLFRYYYVDQSEEDEPLFFSPVEIGKFMFSKEVSAQTGDRINTTLTNLEALKQSVADEYEVISRKENRGRYAQASASRETVISKVPKKTTKWHFSNRRNARKKNMTI